MRVYLLIFITILLSGPLVQAQAKNETQRNPSLSKPADYLSENSICNINNIIYWISEDGQMAHDPFTGSSGFYFPGRTATAVYSDGIIWGGYSRDGQEPVLRVGGQFYNCGTVPGRIVEPGIAHDPNDPAVRIYRIRRD